MNADDIELLATFLGEAADAVDVLDACLLDIEDEPTRREPVAEFMRTAHTLKGGAGMVRLVALVGGAHALESVMQRVGDGRLSPEPRVFDRLARALSSLRAGLARVEPGGAEPEELVVMGRDLASWLGELGVEALSAEKKKPQRSATMTLGEYDLVRCRVLEGQGKKLYVATLRLPPGLSDAQRWAVGVVRALRRIGDVVTTDPPASELDRLAEFSVLRVLLGTKRTAEALAEALGVRGAEAASVAELGERKEREAPGNAAATLAAVPTEPTLHVGREVLDQLLRLVGELVLARDALVPLVGDAGRELDDAELARDVEASRAELERLAADLQDAVLAARRVPLSRVFRTTHRELRELARARGQRLSLTTTGGQTELDEELVVRVATPIARFARALLEGGGSSGPLLLTLDARRRWDHVIVTLQGGQSSAAADDVSLRVLLAELGGHLENGPDGSHAIALPLTRAIVRVLLARVGDELFALPVEAVHELQTLPRAGIEQVQGSDVIELRGRALSLLPLRRVLDVRGPDDARDMAVVVLQQPGPPLGLAVDEIVGIREVVIRPLRSPHVASTLFRGCAVLGEERVALLLDVEALVREALEGASRPRVSAAPLEAP